MSGQPICPSCGKAIEVKTIAFPFCSKECQLVDLGKWATEKYRIAAAKEEEEDESAVETPN